MWLAKGEDMKVIMISVSSDIGYAMYERWKAKGWDIYGTYRIWNKRLMSLDHLVWCDLADTATVTDACNLLKNVKDWDVLVMCPGTQEPVGLFKNCNFDEWAESIRINFTNQMRIVHELLPTRNKNACVLFFAGGSMNRATKYYSAYTASKIALVRMCELLDFEIPDMRFAIVGPGWVKTKIHDSTLKAKEKAGDDYHRTVEQLGGDRCTPMKDVLDCCDWIINSPREVVSGRNFSVVADGWGDEYLEWRLKNNPTLYKMRRVE